MVPRGYWSPRGMTRGAVEDLVESSVPGNVKNHGAVGGALGKDRVQRQWMADREAQVAILDRGAEHCLRCLIGGLYLARGDDHRRLVYCIQDGMGDGVDGRHGADP